MAFDPNAKLDPGEVRDARGSGFGIGGRGLAIGGGGGLGVVLLVVYLMLGGNPANLGGGVANPDVTYPGANLSQDCQTGADANTKDECRVVGYVDSVQKYWSGELSNQSKHLPRPCCSPARSTRDAAPRPPMSAPSTAPSTSTCTSTSGSSTS